MTQKLENDLCKDPLMLGVCGSLVAIASCAINKTINQHKTAGEAVAVSAANLEII